MALEVPEGWAIVDTLEPDDEYTDINGDGWLVYKFTSSGNVTFSRAGDVEYLVVAGGGGGGSNVHFGRPRNAGGGGAGGLLQGTAAVTASNYSVVVGAGGAAGYLDTKASPGGNSSAFGFTAAGGGYGGGGSGNTGSNGQNAGNGGSGGGAGRDAAGGTAVSGQGYAGGTGASQTHDGGAGGGGAGGVGVSSTGNNGCNGGPGLQVSITGAAVWYAGGGGGGSDPDTGSAGLGGSGGGGTAGSAGTPNTGGGGGGEHLPNAAGAGGSGVVIFRTRAPVDTGGGEWDGLDLSNVEPGDLYYGSNQVVQLRWGSEKVWPYYAPESLWTPAGESSLVAWWDASDTGSLTTSGNLVTQIASQFVGGPNLIAETNDHRMILSPVTPQFNNRQTLIPTSDWYESLPSTRKGYVSDDEVEVGTIFVVTCYMDGLVSTVTAKTMLLGNYAIAGNAPSVTLDTGGVGWWTNSIGSDATANGGTWPTTPQVLPLKPSSWAFRRNSSSLTFTPQFGYGTESPQTWPGPFSEVVIFSDIITFSQDLSKRMHGYLAHKWGFDEHLVPGSPYTLVPPLL